ncbi:hypothetical protein ISN44_As08g032610 [Arabidopsis suecica]|uniref:Uncharacterized protein n=1 Tax=Arabidopsis suecica TaxID=45249 RepID=A0A8T2BF04_ARASU|nr:hypothetical protein ISN44_As08g032610 [Arabidopsis suecica]
MYGEHLYTFEVLVEVEATSEELVFDFKLNSEKWEIGECGIRQSPTSPSKIPSDPVRRKPIAAETEVDGSSKHSESEIHGSLPRSKRIYS